MSEFLHSLVIRDRPIAVPIWEAFWRRLDTRQLGKGEAVAVLASLSTLMPDADTCGALLDSLATRRAQGQFGDRSPAAWRGTVNLVGTGGGPATFNMSTAAALVAAAAGTPTVKTGSRGYTSRHGSIDVLQLLGIPLCRSYVECEEFLDRFGVAFAGGFVYPSELTVLARLVVPYEWRRLGRVFNTLGPFLADVPVAAQITGVSDPEVHSRLTAVARRAPIEASQPSSSPYPRPDIWLVRNDLGVDELISFAENWVETGHGTSFSIGLGATGPSFAPGTLAELRPVPGDKDPVGPFLAVLRGRGSVPAQESVCLNAAAAAMAVGTHPDWPTALRAATEALMSGAAAELVERLRAHQHRPGLTARATTSKVVGPHA